MTPRPEVGAVAEELYARMATLAFADEGVWHMLLFFQAVGLMLQEIEDYVRDTDEQPGFAVWMDPNVAPAKGLPWLGQFAGKRIPAGLDEIEQREWLKGTDGFDRGSPDALAEAARRYLIGPDGDGASAYVIINERQGGNAYALAIRTLVSETPNDALVQAALEEQVPGGVILDYDTAVGQTYDTVYAAFDTYQDVMDEYPSYGAMYINLPDT